MTTAHFFFQNIDELKTSKQSFSVALTITELRHKETNEENSHSSSRYQDRKLTQVITHTVPVGTKGDNSHSPSRYQSRSLTVLVGTKEEHERRVNKLIMREQM